jgi:hypothetical protein
MLAFEAKIANSDGFWNQACLFVTLALQLNLSDL